MNIIENGAIDWSMFGMALRSFRRDKNLTEEQFADLMNRNGEVIDEKTVKKIEAGKTTPNVYQLSALDRLTGRPNRTIKAISDLADYLINGTTDKGASDSDIPMDNATYDQTTTWLQPGIKEDRIVPAHLG